MQRKEGAFLQTPALPFHFWLPLLPPILPFCFKCFLLASFSSQEEEKEKKCRERRELSFQFLFYPFTFGSCFCPFVSNTFSKHLFLLEQKKRKKKP